MLVLTRKEQQRIVIAENISLTILEIRRNCVRIGIQAPEEMPIIRTRELLLHQDRWDDGAS